MSLRAPFPYFGGKSAVAAEIWARLGDVPNYGEPFFGSGAVLLARPKFAGRRTETVNDIDGFVSNFWRAVQADHLAVAQFADWPVNERDLEARHYWLVTEGRAILDRFMGDPDAYDAQVAGWWVWGLCNWIGSGFATGAGPWQWTGDEWTKAEPVEGNGGRGINRKLPHLGDAGRGINRQLPHLGDAGRGINRGQGTIAAMLAPLAERLRDVRVASGDWARICTNSVTDRGQAAILTGVFLDPPYANAGRADVYTHDCGAVAETCRAWAIEAGKRPTMRICLAGYSHEHDMPGDWTAYRWKAQGGFSGQSDGQGRENALKETLWFSPHCIKAQQGVLL